MIKSPSSSTGNGNPAPLTDDLRAQTTTPPDPTGGTPFTSILYIAGADATARAPAQQPEYFPDLNLDQIVATITTGKDAYDLKPFFHDALRSPDAIAYRHEVMRDIEDTTVLECIKAFAAQTGVMRDKLKQAKALHYAYQQQRWILHAIDAYCAAITAFDRQLGELTFSSRGLLAFRRYLRAYREGAAFRELNEGARAIADELATIRYETVVLGGGFKVRKYNEERDYSVEVLGAFKKFQQADSKNYRVKFNERPEMNHIEAQILDYVALLFRDTFAKLTSFVGQHANFADSVITTFDREVQFYVGYLEFIAPLRADGLSFCYPGVSDTDKDVFDEDAFDLALATKLHAAKTPIVCNDFALRGPERLIVVSGPNQGGKTTFARTFGQLHHLASIGCLVPGRKAQLFLFDAIYTHFEKEENIHNLRGKLQDDLMRVHDILERATPQSILILNEIFNSTTLKDAVFLARKVLDRVLALDALCVCVTFLDELSRLSDKTVSMVSTVVPEDPAQRTYKVVRRPADGRSYALSIAEKYRVTHDHLLERIPAS